MSSMFGPPFALHCVYLLRHCVLTSSLCNAFSYWQDQVISNATGSLFDDIMQAFGHIQTLSGSNGAVELWIGETGWTTGDVYTLREHAVRTWQYGTFCQAIRLI